MLVRSHHQASVRGGGDDLYGLPPATKLLTIQRWSILWRSIIASALDATLFPYCKYIKNLDFRDLGNLLDEDQFRNKVYKQFFAGPLKPFEKTETFVRKGRKGTRLKNTAIIDAIGEAVTQYTPMLELLSGELSSDALVRWTPRLPRLQTLEIYDGFPLEDELVHASIREHCPKFDTLMIYTWRSETENSDFKFAKFLGALPPNSLKQLNTISDIRAAAETFLSMNQHGQSLEDLRICISTTSAPFLGLLEGCTALKHLRIEDYHGQINLEATQNDVYLEVVAWLKKCENLQQMVFPNFQSGAAIATPVMLEHKIKLTHLELDNYILKDQRTFHQALVHQQSSLKYLSLSGDTDEMFRDDLDILVDSLKQLHQLRELKLILPEILKDEHLISILHNMTLLEDLYVSGLELNDVLLDSVAALANLRSVTLSGISKFTVDGLLDFVSKLGPGNAGIRVSIDMADPDTMLSEDSVTMIRECLIEKIGGTLEYMALRGMDSCDFLSLDFFHANDADTDPNISEFEGDSD